MKHILYTLPCKLQSTTTTTTTTTFAATQIPSICQSAIYALFAQIPTQIIRRSRDADDNAKPLHCFYCVSGILTSCVCMYKTCRATISVCRCSLRVGKIVNFTTLNLAPEPLAVEREYIRHRRRAHDGVVIEGSIWITDFTTPLTILITSVIICVVLRCSRSF